MTLEETIKRLKDPNIHETIFPPKQLETWLVELRDARELVHEVKNLITYSVTGQDMTQLYIALSLIKKYEEGDSE